MHPHDEQPTTAFPTSALRAPTTTKRHRWLLVAVITAVVAAVIAIVMAFTIPDESQPTVAGRNSSNVPGAKPDKKAQAAARQAWAHQYGIDPKTSTDLPDVASATDAQRQAAIDLLSRTEAATAGWSDLDAAKEEPSLIEIDSERAQYWLGVGAQPTEPVAALLKITGDWQKFKGLPGAEGTLKVKEPKPSKLDLFNAALANADAAPAGEAVTLKKRKDKKEEAAEAAAETADVAGEADAAETAEAEAPAE